MAAAKYKSCKNTEKNKTKKASRAWNQNHTHGQKKKITDEKQQKQTHTQN